MYSDLFKQMEDFIVELHSRQEQQRVEEEEAAQMKKLREEQARVAAAQDALNRNWVESMVRLLFHCFIYI